MPIRFRKTLKIFPGVKANLSKGGISFTIGTKGYHLNFSRRGVRQTVGLPGSGVSNTTYLIKNETKQDPKDKKERAEPAHPSSEETEFRQAEHLPARAQRRHTPAWMLLLGIVVIYIGALVLGLIPMNFLSQLLHTLTVWTRSLGL